MKTLYLIILLLLSLGSAQAQWTDPVLMDFNHDTVGINTGHKEWCPFISADGQYFYFAREAAFNNDLFVCHREGDGWSVPLKIPFCTDPGDERNPAVNVTNDTLYFITFSEGWDIFWSFRTGPSDTSWGTPQRMPNPINSDGIEFSVWVTPDNQRLLFSSWRIGANGEDIYECRRDATTPTGWSDPTLVPGRLNTGNAGFLESYPSMGLDTTEMFFWGRYSKLYRSILTDNGWTVGDSLPDTINRVIGQYPSEVTPCITPDGHRLYFSSSWGPDSVPTAGDIWYSERILGVTPRSGGLNNRQHGLQMDVYPNPARETISFIPAGLSIGRVEISNILGQRVAEWSGASTLSPILVSLFKLGSGSYFYQLYPSSSSEIPIQSSTFTIVK